jgi:hypothetical protein
LSSLAALCCCCLLDDCCCDPTIFFNWFVTQYWTPKDLLATQFHGFRELGQFLWQSRLLWFYCHLWSSFGIFLNALLFVNLNHESMPCCCQRMWNLAHEIFKHIFGPWSLKSELWNQSIVLSFMTIFGQ